MIPSSLKKIAYFFLLIASLSMQGDRSIQKEYCNCYKTTAGEAYLKDFNRSLLEGATGKDTIIETTVLGLPLLSVEEANELLTHLLFGLWHTKDLASTTKDATAALTAAKLTSYLIAALRNLGIKLPEWVRNHRDIHYHVATLLKGATRKHLRLWLQGLCCSSS